MKPLAGESERGGMADMAHIIALSGGKDSTAMALRLAEVEPKPYTYVCTPTGDELPGMEDHWNRCEDLLGAPIVKLGDVSLVDLTKRERMLPNWRARFCTRMLKIQPFQHWVCQHLPATIYIGLRADEPPETRAGYDNEFPLAITVRYPLREWGWTISDVWAYLAERQVTIPRRTDCARCFFQTLHEWYLLWRDHPDIYASAEDDEARTGHTYRSPQRDTWPAALSDLREQFEGGRIPKPRKRGEGCRTCSL